MTDTLSLKQWVVYEFVGAGGEKHRLIGRVLDLFTYYGQHYADVLIGRQLYSEPIRIELLRPATVDDFPEARHVLC